MMPSPFDRLRVRNERAGLDPPFLMVSLSNHEGRA
jgi:hypothetical protein